MAMMSHQPHAKIGSVKNELEPNLAEKTRSNNGSRKPAEQTGTVKDPVERQRILSKIKKLVERLDNFIGMAPGDNGQVQFLASSNLKMDDTYSILGEAVGNFHHYLQLEHCPREMRRPSEKHVYSLNHKLAPEADIMVQDASAGSVSYAYQRPAKRHRSGTVEESAGALHSLSIPQPRGRKPRQMPHCNSPATQVRVDDVEKLQQWFNDAFVALQQVACRLIAKVWIKKIHPRKQSTHPYNGGLPRDRPPDPNRTRPDYWPSHITHREPDHINRTERTALLVHLIMNTPQVIVVHPKDGRNHQYVTARGLSDCLEEKRNELNEERWDIMQHIIKAREMMEQYNSGEIDGDCMIFLPDFSDGHKLAGDDSDSEMPTAVEEDVFTEEQDPNEIVQVTPATSTEPSPPESEHIRNMHHSAGPRSTIREKRQTSINKPNQLSPTTMAVTGHEVPVDVMMRSGRFNSSTEYMASESVMHNPRSASKDQCSPPMMGAIQQHISPELSPGMNPFTTPLDPAGHEATMRDTREVLHAIPSNEVRQQNMVMQHWPGMVPGMGGMPVEQQFEMQHSQQLMGPPNNMEHAFFQQQLPDSSLHGGITVMDPMQYENFHGVNQHQQRMPIRAMSGSHSGMMTQGQHNVEMMPAAYYGI